MILRSKVKPSVRVCWHLLGEAAGNGETERWFHLELFSKCDLMNILFLVDDPAWTCELIAFMNDSAWSCDHMGFCSHCWGSRLIIFSVARRAAFEDSVQSNSKAANSIPSSPALKIFKQKQFSWRSYKYQGEECHHKTLQKWLKTSSKGLMVLTQIFPTSKVGVKLVSAGTNWFLVTIIQHPLGHFNMKMAVSLRSSLPWFLRADFRFSLFSYIANKKEHVYPCVHIPFNKWSNKSFYCHRPGLPMNKPSANSSTLNI